MATRINFILDAPSAPVVDKWSANHVVLKWEEPLSDSGSPITGYIVEKMDSDSQVWEKTVITSSPVPCATINGLMKGNKYHFRIIAFNNAGQSEPSEVSKEFVAERRYLTRKNVKRHLSDVTQSPGIKLEAARAKLTPDADWRTKQPRTSTPVHIKSDSVPLADNLLEPEEISNHPQTVERVQLLEMLVEEIDETMEKTTLDLMPWVVDSGEATKTKPPTVHTCETPIDSSDLPVAYSKIDGSASAAGNEHVPTRGGSRGRGRRTRGSAEKQLNELDLIRSARQVKQRRVAALPAKSRQELLTRKRESQLARVLLPDAPPSKKLLRMPSPQREPSQFVGTPGLVVLEAPGPSTSCGPTAHGRTFIDINDMQSELVVDDWLRIVDELSDCDPDEVADDETSPSHTQPRNASEEPSVESDLTLYQTSVLRKEDRQNDLAVRQLMADDTNNFEWKKERPVFTGERETFTGTSGPTFMITDETRIVELFYRMIDNDFIDRLCTETNRYADQKITLMRQNDKLTAGSRFLRWVPVDRDEMISFLALTILQGIYHLPDEKSYFSFNGFGTMPYFRRIMTYNRYILLKSLLHFVDNDSITEPTRLCKIRPIIDYFNDKFSTLYMPAQEIVIDESLLKWHGRLGFAQKIATKAAKVGVKTYELCEASTGYLWKFFVYAGKNTTTTTNDETSLDNTTNDDNDFPATGATAKIVHDLAQPLFHRGHTLIMDNFYNSPLLARFLKRNKTDCYGTLRLNREFVPDSLKTMSKTDLQQGEVVASYCSDLSICVWRDAKLVSLISTYHTLQIGTRHKHNRLTYKPCIVLDYNKSMGGVDRKDQYLSGYPMERTRNKIWYKKLFRHLLNTAIFNTYVIFKSAHTIAHRQYRTTLAEDLLKLHRNIDLTSEPRIITSRHSLTSTPTNRSKLATGSNRPKVEHRHFPVRNTSKYCRCWMCSKKKVISRTTWKCQECNVNLCVGECFIEYHT